MKNYFLLFALLLAFQFLNAQTLPEFDFPITSNNYFDICQQLDAYFEKEYEADDTDCWDNAQVKYERWKWFWRDRVNPDGSFPDLKSQWLERRKHFAGIAQSRDNQAVWKNEGPTKNPAQGYWGMGRTKHVAIHPNNPLAMYVGTPDGGVWKTEDGGASWTALGDGLPYLPVAIILIDFQHPDTLYISLGDKGGWWQRNLGVYKSTDGGITWSPTGLDWTLDDFKVIYEMVMSPADPQTIFAATNHGILRTTDGGANWENIRPGEYTDIQFRPGDATTLYAAYHNYWEKSQLIKSTDGGATWTQMTNSDVQYNTINIAVTAANPDWVGIRYSQGKKFYLSKDGGATFEYKSEMPEDAHFAFSQVDTNIVYTSNVVVHRSTDQGATWSQITNWYNNGVHAEVHADVHDIVPNPLDLNEIYFCNDGGIYKYHEPTETWTDLSDGLGIAQFYRISVSEGGFLRIAAGSQDNGGWLRTSNSTWKHTNGGDAMCQAIDPNNSSVIYTEYYGGNTIYRSDNLFFTYTVISDNLPDDPSGDWVTPFLLNPQNSNTFLVGFHDLYRSFDRGDHFHKISDNLTGSVDNKIRDVVYAPSDTNIILATWKNRVFRTINGGQNWTTHYLPGSEDITRVAIHPHHPSRVWAVKGGYEAGKKVYRSLNGGQTWNNISADFPNVPVNCVLFDSVTNYLLVGTDIGVFYTDADAISWQPYGQGMPNVYVFDLKIRAFTRTLYAGTHGRGVYSVPLETLVSTDEQDDISAENEIVTFPNPTRTTLFFKTKTDLVVNGAAQLFDVNGRLVSSLNLTNQPLRQASLDVSRLPAGIYFLKITDEKGMSLAPQKVVVQKRF